MALPDVVNVQCASCNKGFNIGIRLRTEDTDQGTTSAGTQQATGAAGQQVQSDDSDQWPRKVGTEQATVTAVQNIRPEDADRVGPLEKNLVGIQCENCHSYFCQECVTNNKNGSTRHKYQQNNCPKCGKVAQPFHRFLRPGYNPNLVWLDNQPDTIKTAKRNLTILLTFGPVAIIVIAVIGFVVWALGAQTGFVICRWILFAIGISILGVAWSGIKEIAAGIQALNASHNTSQYLATKCTYCHEYVLLYAAKFQYACESCTKLVDLEMRNSSYLPQLLTTGVDCTHCKKPNPLENRPAAFRCNACGQINDLEKIPSS